MGWGKNVDNIKRENWMLQSLFDFFPSYNALITVDVVPSPSPEHNDKLKSEKILVLVFKKIRMIKTE